jgi:hypothetical protein
MHELQKYLSKYLTLTPPEASKVKLLVSVIRDECGITLTESAVTLRRGGAMISCHPTVRSELAQCIPHVLATLHTKHNVHLAFLR